MSPSDEPFEVEDLSDEDEARLRRPVEDVGAGNGRPAADDVPYVPDSGRGPEEPEVDTRTVAERRGTAVEVVAGRRPPPAGWPLEALVFPLRSPGPRTIVGSAVLWALLDLLTLAGDVGFAGYLLKLLVLPLFLRWQVHVAAMTAGGWDRPAGWGAAMNMGGDQLLRVVRLVVVAAVLAVLFVASTWLGPTWLVVVAGVVASYGLATTALGFAVGDSRLLWPWHGLLWVARHPLGLAVASLGWWAVGLAELVVPTLSEASLALSAAACLALRLGVFYVWLVSARALGVVGRSWSPFAEE